MKIIKLFLLLSLMLWAECKQDIPNENAIDIKLLQNVVENGWNDKHDTLNQFITRYQKNALQCVLEKIDKPILTVEPTKDDVSPLPKIRLTKADYWNLLWYMKYLEYIGESEKVLHIYIQIFDGLNNIGDKSLLSMIYRMEIEKITVIGLKQALASHRFTYDQKKIFKERLSKGLLLNAKIFFDTLETERESVVRVLAKENTFQEDFGKEVLEKVDYLLKSYNKEFYAISTKDELEVYEKKFKEVKKEFIEIYNKCIDKKNLSHEKMVNLVAGFIVFEGALNWKFSSVKIDLWRNIETNKDLLNTL